MEQYVFYLLIACFSGFLPSLFANPNNQLATIQERMDDLAVFLGTTQFIGSEINKEALPAPYDFLLTQPLMTLGIEKYYQRIPVIQLIHKERNQKNNTYSRAIYMLLDRYKYKKSKIPRQRDPKKAIVELAFITMNFNELPEQAIFSILNSNTPFGKILVNNKINVVTDGRAYFSVNCNSVLVKVLHCKKNSTLYGRINTLIRKDNKKWISKVIEILPGLTCNNKQCSVILENQ